MFNLEIEQGRMFTASKLVSEIKDSSKFSEYLTNTEEKSNGIKLKISFAEGYSFAKLQHLNLLESELEIINNAIEEITAKRIEKYQAFLNGMHNE